MPSVNCGRGVRLEIAVNEMLVVLHRQLTAPPQQQAMYVPVFPDLIRPLAVCTPFAKTWFPN